jgi:glycosylphosphatidylinositol transamidase (GPIT) subunit GPI8
MAEMHAKGMYKEAFLMLDTCEAASMFDDITAPNLFLLGTSKHGESAVSDKVDGMLNTHMQDKPTAALSYWLDNLYARKPNFNLG